MTIRKASNESAETRHRLSAAALTIVAGALPLWLGHAGYFSLVYLAIGVLTAWAIAKRNVPAEIHGPFQSKNP